MGAVAESGRNLVSKHQVQPERRISRLMGRDRTHLAMNFPFSADHKQDPYSAEISDHSIYTYIHIDIYRCRKERSKRPHQSKRPGALKIAIIGAYAPGRLFKKRPGAFFSRFFDRKAPWSESPRHEVCDKDLLPKRNSTGIFVSLQIYLTIKAFLLYMCLD